MNFDSANVVVDPFINFSAVDSQKPIIKSPVSEKDLGKVDIVLLSQEHFDHFDRKAVEYFCKNHKSIIVGHESVLQEINVHQSQKKPVMTGNKLTLLGVEIEVLPAHYPKSFYPMSYVLRDKKSSVFFAADTALTEQFNTPNIGVALLPIGGGETMDVVDAVKATKTIKPQYAIPMHYDTFESIKADPNEFKARIEKSILKTIPVILKPGQKFNF